MARGLSPASSAEVGGVMSIGAALCGALPCGRMSVMGGCGAAARGCSARC